MTTFDTQQNMNALTSLSVSESARSLRVRPVGLSVPEAMDAHLFASSIRRRAQPLSVGGQLTVMMLSMLVLQCFDVGRSASSASSQPSPAADNIGAVVSGQCVAN